MRGGGGEIERALLPIVCVFAVGGVWLGEDKGFDRLVIWLVD